MANQPSTLNTSAQAPKPLQPAKLIADLEAMKAWQENWNGYDVATPNPDSIEAAKRWIATFYCLAVSQDNWKDPLAGPDENGDIVFEWWKGDKSLSVYVSSSETSFLKSGEMPSSESDEGVADTDQEMEALWNWLNS